MTPLATKILGWIETNDYWAYGISSESLTEDEVQALSTAKTKGGYFNATDNPARSDLIRLFYTEKNELLERIQEIGRASCRDRV